MAESTETEVKLLVDGRGRQLTELPVIGSALKHASRKRIETSYYDTPDHILERQGYVLRLRKGDGAPLLSVKQAGGAIVRKEWECRISGDARQSKDWRGTPIEPLLKAESTRALLRPLFTTVIDRASFDTEYEGAVIEVAFDRGEITHDGRELPVSEIEFELKRGQPEAVFKLARELAGHAPLRLGLLSKGERGHLLNSGHWEAVQPATTPALAGMTSLRDGIQIICRTCLKDFILNHAALDAGYNEEAVHQARIAIRRLRSALALFKSRMADAERPRLKHEIKWLWEATGPARDLDVMYSELESEANRADMPPGTATLIEIIRARRDAARRKLLAALQSDRTRLLLIDLAHWIENGDWSRTRSAAPGEPIMAAVSELLDKRLRKLQRIARGIAKANPRERHRVRITAKELRLMCEFFRSLVEDGKSRRRYDQLVAVLEKLQKVLGRLQDRATRDEQLAQIAREARSVPHLRQEISVDAAAKALISDSRKAPAKQLKQLKKASAKLADAHGFWR
jgi:triphosphatase